MTTADRCQELHTYYGASHILRGIDFRVARGETIGLMGRNGMGKSTLLKSIMGLVKPRSGGRDRGPADDRRAHPTKSRAWASPTCPRAGASFGNLSVVENLEMAARAGTRGPARLDLRAGAGRPFRA